MDLNKQKSQNGQSQKKVSKLLVFAILTNALIIILFVAFVFGLRPDLFEIDINKLDRQMSLYIDTLNKNIDEYSSRIKKIAASYPFDEFIQSIILDKDVIAEKEKIMSLFRSGEHTFSSVSIFTTDGKNIFSIPVNIVKNSISFPVPPYAKMPIIVYDKNYEGINLTQNITNTQGITTSYLNASVDKKIFDKTPSKNKFILFDSGIIFYDEGVNINSISKDTLSLMIRNTKKDNAELVKIDQSPYILYSTTLDKIQSFNIAIIVKDISPLQKYLRYIILSLFLISFIIMIIFTFIENRKNAVYAESDILNDLENELEDFSDELYSKDAQKENSKIANKKNHYDKKIIEKITDDFPIDNLDDNNISIPYMEPEEDYTEKIELENDYILNDYIESTDDIVDEDIMVQEGKTLEEEINRKEEEYFSGKDAFNISLDEDFLYKKTTKKDKVKIEETYEDEKIKLEEIDLNTFKIDEDDMHEETEVPKVPDAYFKNYTTKEENYKFQNIIDVLKYNTFKNKNFDDIINLIEKKSNTKIKSAAMLKLIKDSERYIIDDIKNVSLYTKSTLEIDMKEPLFTKFLSYRKPLYIKNPFDSIVISKKFAEEDKENISSMLFIPVEKNNGVLENFFVALF